MLCLQSSEQNSHPREVSSDILFRDSRDRSTHFSNFLSERGVLGSSQRRQQLAVRQMAGEQLGLADSAVAAPVLPHILLLCILSAGVTAFNHGLVTSCSHERQKGRGAHGDTHRHTETHTCTPCCTHIRLQQPQQQVTPGTCTSAVPLWQTQLLCIQGGMSPALPRQMSDTAISGSGCHCSPSQEVTKEKAQSKTASVLKQRTSVPGLSSFLA